MRYVGGGATLTREESAAQISKFERHWGERGFGLWALEERASGAMIGFVGLVHLDDWARSPHETEVGWRLDRSFWGRGLATEGAAASVRYGFEEIGLESIISIIQPENVASRRVAEKVGLTLRGEARWRGHDVVWYGIDRREWSGEP